MDGSVLQVTVRDKGIFPGQDGRKFRRWDSRKQFCDPELLLVENLRLFLFLLWLCVGKACVEFCGMFRAVPAISLDSCTYSSCYLRGCSLVIKEKQKRTRILILGNGAMLSFEFVSCGGQS